MAHAGFSGGIGTTAKKVAGQIQKESDDTVTRYLVLLDMERIGEMVHRQINPRVCEIGIKICDSSKQNQGYGKKILSLFSPVFLTAFIMKQFNWIPTLKTPELSIYMKVWDSQSWQ